MEKEDSPLDKMIRLRVRMVQSHNHELDCRIEALEKHVKNQFDNLWTGLWTLESLMKDVIMKLEALENEEK